ncbi:MAG: DNA topoisomerase [Rhodomicrobium sp.]
MPPLIDGEMARLTEPRVDAKRTQAPPRYNEGTLIDAMQNAWRFVENAAVRERLKEAKGIGTPATRAEIIKGLKKQNLLAADGKWVVPTGAGLQLFEVLRGAAPALVDPGTTAEWEMQLDAVVTGNADHRRVIDAIAVEAEKLIGVLQQRGCGSVDLTAAPAKREPRRTRRAAAAKEETAVARPSRRKTASAKPKRPRRGNGKAKSAPETSAATRAAPTARMVAYAEKLAKTKKLPLPAGYAQDFQACRRFLDQHG